MFPVRDIMGAFVKGDAQQDHGFVATEEGLSVLFVANLIECNLAGGHLEFEDIDLVRQHKDSINLPDIGHPFGMDGEAQ